MTVAAVGDEVLAGAIAHDDTLVRGRACLRDVGAVTAADRRTVAAAAAVLV